MIFHTLIPMRPRLLLLLLACSGVTLFAIASIHSRAAMRAAQDEQSRAPSPAASLRDERLWQHALALHRQAIVIDTHNDIPTPMTNDDYDLGGEPPFPYRTNIARMRQGGLTAEFFSIFVRREYAEHGGAAKRAEDMINAVYRAAGRHPQDLMMATTVADIRRAKQQNKIAALMGIEGGHAIENSLANLQEFYRRGVRYMTLTWNNTNDWADAARGQPLHNGLTDFGKQVVREMNRMGMLVDVSHVSDKTMSDVLDISSAPIMASHSSARALADHPRNIPDDLLRRIARNGGVVQVNFYTAFIDPRAIAASSERAKRLRPQYDAIEQRYANDPERRSEEEDKIDAANPLQPPTPLSVLIDHIDHIVKVAGIDHVGLGADFDGAMDMPEGAKDVSQLPNITYELLRRGYSDADVRKILGENFLRVFAAAERVAARNTNQTAGNNPQLTNKKAAPKAKKSKRSVKRK